MACVEFIDISYSGIKCIDLRYCRPLLKVTCDASQTVIVRPKVLVEVLGVTAAAGIHDTK